MHKSKALYFVSFCIEAYKMRHQLLGSEVLKKFEQFGVIDYLLMNYKVLHTLSEQNIVDDIDEFILSKQ